MKIFLFLFQVLFFLAYGCVSDPASLDSLKNALQQDPTNAEVHIQLGMKLEQSKAFKEADSHYLNAIEISRKTLRTHPDRALAHFNLGVSYIFLAQYPEGIRSLEKAFRLDGHLKQKALQMFDHSINEVFIENPRNVRAYYGIGVAYISLGNYEKAKEALQDAIRIDSDNANFHFSLGTVYGKLENAQDEISEYKKALKIYPNEPDVHYNLASAYGELNLYSEALSEYREVLRLNPNHVEALNNLGGVYGALGNFHQAIAEYNKALRIEPRNPVAHYNLGVAYDRINKGYEAITHMIEAEHLFEELHDKAGGEQSRNNLQIYYKKYGLSPGNVSRL